MSVQVDFVWQRGTSITIQTNLAPATPIGGKPFQFQMGKQFGWESGLITKLANSGYGGGVSGITITDSGQGQFSTRLNASDGSGLDFGTYAYQITCQQSGAEAVATEGYCLITP